MEFSPAGEEGRAGRMGNTADVSAGGLYFWTPEWEGLGVGQGLTLRLSGLDGLGSGPLFRSLRSKATILRLDPPETDKGRYAKGGIAVRFDERPRFDVYRSSA
ncbi:MAG: hypothetical protein KAX19_06865 [Candidatus Brocadiae bacterium]|nr:hypothetical protein [Candidatus Brocadiia bacterium]